MLRADLALVGFGHVGRRFAALLDDSRGWLQQDLRLDCRVVAIATRHGCLLDPSGVDAQRAAARLASGHTIGAPCSAADAIRQLAASDAPLRIVIETTTLDVRDGQPAIAHVEAALDSGCHVITANKGPTAFAYRRLARRAARAGVSFLFEGAVMDGVPIFNLVRETLPGVRVDGFRGIVNTTTQHILSAIERGEPFDAALARMQAEGIAEADPSMDVDGWDAAAKTAALANVLLDADLTPHTVDRQGLDAGTADAVRRAMASGRRLRLVVSAARDAERVRASVRLAELEPGDPLATLPGTANALVLSTDLLGDIAICQMSGNLTQTAYALLSDLATVARRASGVAAS